jgi:hypothetical protein
MPGAGKDVFFIINLLQDVNIVRGLVYLAARETNAQLGFLITKGFIKRDRQKIWQSEVARMATDTGANMYVYGDALEALAILQPGGGLIFAAAESNLPAHREVSEVFDVAPSTYLRVTLQHGLECVGFVQSREHVLSHGRNVSFHADIVCGWFEAGSLTSLTASQRAKLYVTGPPTLLQARPRTPNLEAGDGLVCENLHSVRLRASGDHKTSFMDVFFAFCSELAKRHETVTLRPHPGGQYVLKNNVELPSNVRLNNRPIYETDLSAYRFGISAPSTIVFDMVLAGIPVGVWRDPGGIMDAENYDGLTAISALDDWMAFERDVRLRPDMIIARQSEFLRRLSMPTDPQEIYRRFARLIVSALEAVSVKPRETSFADNTSTQRPRQVALSDKMLVAVN